MGTILIRCAAARHSAVSSPWVIAATSSSNWTRARSAVRISWNTSAGGMRSTSWTAVFAETVVGRVATARVVGALAIGLRRPTHIANGRLGPGDGKANVARRRVERNKRRAGPKLTDDVRRKPAAQRSVLTASARLTRLAVERRTGGRQRKRATVLKKRAGPPSKEVHGGLRAVVGRGAMTETQQARTFLARIARELDVFLRDCITRLTSP